MVRELEQEIREVTLKIASIVRYHKIEVEEIFAQVLEELDNRDTYDENMNLIEF